MYIYMRIFMHAIVYRLSSLSWLCIYNIRVLVYKNKPLQYNCIKLLSFKLTIGVFLLCLCVCEVSICPAWPIVAYLGNDYSMNILSAAKRSYRMCKVPCVCSYSNILSGTCICSLLHQSQGCSYMQATLRWMQPLSSNGPREILFLGKWGEWYCKVGRQKTMQQEGTKCPK